MAGEALENYVLRELAAAKARIVELELELDAARGGERADMQAWCLDEGKQATANRIVSTWMTPRQGEGFDEWLNRAGCESAVPSSISWNAATGYLHTELRGIYDELCGESGCEGGDAQ